MIQFSIYEISTGLVLRNMRATNIALIELQCEEGQDWVFGWFEEGSVLTEEQILLSEAIEAAGGP